MASQCTYSKSHRLQISCHIRPLLWPQLTLLSPLLQEETPGLSFSFPNWKFFPSSKTLHMLCIFTYCLSTHSSPCSYVSFRADLNVAPLWESTMSHSSKFSPTPTLDPLLSFIVCTHYVCLKWLNRLLTEDRPTCLVHHFYQARSSCFVAKHYNEWLYWVLPCSWGCQGLQRLNDLCQVTLPASGRAGMWI